MYLIEALKINKTIKFLLLKNRNSINLNNMKYLCEILESNKIIIQSVYGVMNNSTYFKKILKINNEIYE